MAMNIWHYVVVFHADRTSFLHSYLSSTLYIVTTRAVHLVIILEYGDPFLDYSGKQGIQAGFR